MNLMKKVKLLTALIAVLLFSNLVFAGNPEILASKMVEKLNNDVQLTDSQKVVLQLKAKEFAVKIRNANSQSNNADKSTSKKQANLEYKTSLDSVLTNDQKTKLNTRITERRQVIIKKYKTNK